MERIAVGVSEYAKKYLLPSELVEIENALPSNVIDSFERNAQGERLVYLENLSGTVHPDFLIIQKH
jgi:hypothetical protein